jgi:uncharacterized protein (DUF2062 family)
LVFKRRDKRSWLRVAAESLWPRGGWGRAAQYVQHRLRRLPDSPDRIARGIFVGVFTTFTPFYGLHFLVAAVLAKLMRGNILASLLATFFGNPLTYLPIGIASLQTGYFLLGRKPLPPPGSDRQNVMDKFGQAAADLWQNFWAIFTPEVAHWDGLGRFYHEVFFPYMIGGIVPGLIFAVIAYYVSFPLITVYQNRRKGRIKQKLNELRQKATKKPNVAD